MLVLCRRLNEGLLLGSQFKVVVIGIRRGAVQLSISGIDGEGKMALRRTSIPPTGIIWCTEGATLQLNQDVAVQAIRVSRSGIRLGISAPASVRVGRTDSPRRISSLTDAVEAQAGAVA